MAKHYPITHREAALILAGLRLLQDQLDVLSGRFEEIIDFGDDGPSTVEEIDALCHAINFTAIEWRRR